MKWTKVVTISIICLCFAGCGEEGSGLTQSQVDQMLEIQQATQIERQQLSRGRDELEADRTLWAERERGDPIIAEAIASGCLLIACCLPILLVIGIYFRDSDDHADPDLCDALLNEVASQRPSLIDHQNDEPKLH